MYKIFSDLDEEYLHGLEIEYRTSLVQTSYKTDSIARNALSLSIFNLVASMIMDCIPSTSENVFFKLSFTMVVNIIALLFLVSLMASEFYSAFEHKKEKYMAFKLICLENYLKTQRGLEKPSQIK